MRYRFNVGSHALFGDLVDRDRGHQNDGGHPNDNARDYRSPDRRGVC